MYEEKKLYLNDFLSNPKQFWDSGFLFLYIHKDFLKNLSGFLKKFVKSNLSNPHNIYHSCFFKVWF